MVFFLLDLLSLPQVMGIALFSPGGNRKLRLINSVSFALLELRHILQLEVVLVPLRLRLMITVIQPTCLWVSVIIVQNRLVNLAS